MKKLSYLLVLLFSVSFISCTDDNSDTLTGNENTGGLITVKNALVGYVVGNGDTFEYGAGFSAFQGTTEVVSVDVYKQFTSVTDGKSQKILLTTIDMPLASQVENMNFTFTYLDLIEDLTVAGSPIDADDSNLNIGDFWLLTYEANTSKGTVALNRQTTKVSVGTRFAGNYQVVNGQYWRIGAWRTDIVWTGTEVAVESVDAVTYRKLEWAGPFSGNEFYFTINSSDVVHVPNSYNGVVQLINGQPVTNAVFNAADLSNAIAYPGLQDVVTKDDVNGLDRIYMTYGYVTPGSGPRELYEVLEKI